MSTSDLVLVFAWQICAGSWSGHIATVVVCCVLGRSQDAAHSSAHPGLATHANSCYANRVRASTPLTKQTEAPIQERGCLPTASIPHVLCRVTNAKSWQQASLPPR